MAATLRVSGSLTYTNGLTSLRLGGSDSVTPGSAYIHNEALIGTTEETLAKGDIGTIGWGMVRVNSTDTAVWLDVGTSTGVYSCRLEGTEKGGESMGPIFFNAAQIYVDASEANVKCEYQLHEA